MTNGSKKRDVYRGEIMPDSYGYGPQIIDFDNGKSDIRKLLYTLWHFKWLILLFTALGGVGAWYYAQNAIPYYKADGSMQISEQRASGVQSDNLSSFLQSNYGFGMSSTLDNEIQVLKSRTFARQVATRLYTERVDSKGDLLPIMWAEYPDDPEVVSEETVYRRLVGKIEILRADRTSDMVRLSFESPSPEEAARIVDLAIQTYSDVSVDMSRQQARNALEFLSGEMERVNVTLGDAEGELQTFMNRESVVKLDEQATQLINSISSLQAEKQAAEIRLASVQTSLRGFTQELNSISPGLSDQLSASIAPRIAQLQNALAELETRKVLLLSRNPNITEADASLRDLNTQINSVRNEIGSIASSLIGDDPNMLGFLGSTDGNLSSRLSKLRETILTLEIEENQLKAMLGLFSKSLGEYDKDFNSIPDNMLELARRTRDLDMNEKLYLLIAEQAAETALWEQTQTGMGRVIDLAELPRNIVRPRKQIIYLIGLGLGFMLAVGMIFVRDLVRNEIDSIEKLEAKATTILTIVPDLKKTSKKQFKKGVNTVLVKGFPISTELTMVIDSISPVSESYRRLQSNVIYAQPDNPLKTIVVTSANKSEGKTTVASNLAIALTESGKRVVILDADFRRPRVHSVFGVEREPGVIEVVFNEIGLQESIKETIVPNVDVLVSGKRPPNPVEISRSERLAEMISVLEEQYDHVIIDTPPYGIISDAAPLIVKSNGVIVCCRFNQTKDPEFDILLKNLANINANVLGSVMTAFDPKKAAGSYYSSYYYKYNYEGYGKYQAE
jgi:capsular exopolysaccharide synthesis family protein